MIDSCMQISDKVRDCAFWRWLLRYKGLKLVCEEAFLYPANMSSGNHHTFLGRSYSLLERSDTILGIQTILLYLKYS